MGYANDWTEVYSILCVPTGKLYFGVSVRSVNNRISWHRAQLKNGKHNNLDLQKDYNQYGENSFVFRKEYETTDEYAAKVEEQQLINLWESYNKFHNSNADWSSRNSAIAYGHSLVRATSEWKEMQSELTRRQHASGRFHRGVK